MRSKAAVELLISDSWRDNPNYSNLEGINISEYISLILRTETCGLIWPGLKSLDLSPSSELSKIEQGYKYYSIVATARTHALAKLCRLMNSANIRFLLGKGWAIARLYREQGLRPYTDFDIYICKSDFDRAKEYLSSGEPLCTSVDCHLGLGDLDDRQYEEAYSRSELASFKDTSIKIFCPEDHLRLLALHMFRHGAWRPLWLCDIAVAFEKRPGDFDWDYFLSGDKQKTEYVIAAIGLAHQLLGAEIEGTPIESRAKNLPRWLVKTVLKQWGQGQNPHGARTPMKQYLQNPSGLLDALRMRWPNGIEATVDLHGRFNNFPRLPYQIADCFVRTGRFLRSL